MSTESGYQYHTFENENEDEEGIEGDADIADAEVVVVTSLYPVEDDSGTSSIKDKMKTNPTRATISSTSTSTTNVTKSM